MTYGILARGLFYQNTGVANYLRGLLSEFNSHPHRSRFIALCSPDTKDSVTECAPDLQTRVISPNVDKLVTRFIWDHFSAPRGSRAAGIRALLAPLHVRPLFSSCPVAIAVHDMMYHSNPEFWPLHQRMYIKTIFRAGIFRSDAVLVPSEYTKQALLSLFPKLQDRIFLVPYGVEDTFRFNTDDEVCRPSTEPYILYLGGFHPRKNVPLLIEVFERIASRFSVRLKLVGSSGWELDQIIGRVQQSPLRERIDILTDVERVKLPALFRSAAVFAFPSLNEGFGFPVLEAMASGCAIISSNRGSLPELLGDAGVLVAPAADQFEHALVTLLENLETRVALGRRATERAARFTWRNCANSTLEILEKIRR